MVTAFGYRAAAPTVSISESTASCSMRFSLRIIIFRSTDIHQMVSTVLRLIYAAVKINSSPGCESAAIHLYMGAQISGGVKYVERLKSSTPVCCCCGEGLYNLKLFAGFRAALTEAEKVSV
jgi:hypothetical protein